MTFKPNTKSLFGNVAKACALTAVVGGISRLSGKKISRSLSLGLFAGALTAVSVISTPAYAISESSVQAYANAMNAAANSQNIGKIAALLSDEAIISLTRNGNTANLDKNGYLQLLQKSWAKAQNYHYDIKVSDVVIVGNQAKAQVITTETWLENGKTTKLITTSKATLSQTGSNAVLLRSVSQVTID